MRLYFERDVPSAQKLFGIVYLNDGKIEAIELKSKFLFAAKLVQLYSIFMRSFSAVYQLACL